MNNYIIRLEFNGSYLNKDKAPFTPNNVVGLFIFYELNTWSKDLNAEFTLKDYLKIVWKCYNKKNADRNKWAGITNQQAEMINST